MTSTPSRVNGAFAPVPLAWLAETADAAKLNPAAAVALGRALGASGARLLATW
jgi:acetyl-CoA acyltransferase